MQVEPRKLPSENLDLHTKFCIPPPVVAPGSLSDMYSTHGLKVPPKVTMERMYSMDSTLKAESNISHVSSPKRAGTMFQSMFNAINLIWEHFSKVPSSFIANANNPLSVTVVQNERIISHEFFKSLTTRKEHLSTDSMYVHDMGKKETLGIIEQVCTFDEEGHNPTSRFNNCLNQKLAVQENTKNDMMIPESNIHELIIKKCDGESTRVEKLRVTVADRESVYNCQENTINSRIDEIPCSKDFIKELLELRNSGSMTTVNDNTAYKSTTSDYPPNSASNTDSNMITRETCQGDCAVPPGERVIGKLLTNMWQRVVEGVTDRWSFRTDTLEQEIPPKRSVSPNKRRKLNTVAKGRGRGRAKSQLRRSGVSQTRHRKERTKHDLELDVNDDIECYHDSELFGILETNTLVDSCNYEDEGIDVPDCVTATVSGIHEPTTFTYGDITPRYRKPKTRKVINQDACKFLTSVRYVPDRTMDFDHGYYDNKYDLQTNTYRPRLISESSVDSEDSYCIIFDTGSEPGIQVDSDLPEQNYESDETSEDESDETDDESESSMQKVIEKSSSWRILECL